MFELDAVQDSPKQWQIFVSGYTEYVMPEGVRLVCAAKRPINYQLAHWADTITTYYGDGTKAVLKNRFKEVK